MPPPSGADHLVTVRVDAIDPPFGSEHGVRFGLRAGRDVDEHVPATGTTEFRTELEIVDGESGPDVRGRHVHGHPGDRFRHLSRGVPDASEPFVMFARAKIRLVDVPATLIDEGTARGGVLVCELPATNDRGQPARGSIRPPVFGWRVEHADS